MTLYMWIATVAWGLLVIGYLFRKQRQLHVTLMLSGIAVDLSLVLFLEITRDAVQTALGSDVSLLEYVHIAASTGAVICYIPTLYFGWKLLGGEIKYRKAHVRVAVIALALRTIGFIFMFSMLEHTAKVS